MHNKLMNVVKEKKKMFLFTLHRKMKRIAPLGSAVPWFFLGCFCFSRVGASGNDTRENCARKNLFSRLVFGSIRKPVRGQIFTGRYRITSTQKSNSCLSTPSHEDILEHTEDVILSVHVYVGMI